MLRFANSLNDKPGRAPRGGAKRNLDADPGNNCHPVRDQVVKETIKLRKPAL
jgi:hypothetical protein